MDNMNDFCGISVSSVADAHNKISVSIIETSIALILLMLMYIGVEHVYKRTINNISEAFVANYNWIYLTIQLFMVGMILKFLLITMYYNLCYIIIEFQLQNNNVTDYLQNGSGSYSW